VAIIKDLLGGERVTVAGKFYHVADHVIAPLPAQRPRPPILIGGNGRELIALAAREADIVGLSGITFRSGGAAPPDLSGWRAAEIDARIELIQQAAGEEGFTRLKIEALLQRVIVTDDRRHAAEELTVRWPQLNANEVLEAPYVLIGTVDQIIEDLLARRERWRISSYTVQEPYMEALAPVVAQLNGK
jgi:alkanesulfonate monooxygenase SsuD/methylene tetrahydromethanopterin reductase-like flavin-dependent oxidoreductase (luciferase family)